MIPFLGGFLVGAAFTAALVFDLLSRMIPKRFLGRA